MAQNASSSPAPVLVNLKGAGQAKYEVNPGNGAKDQIELNWEVNLQFTPQNLLKSGNLVVSHQASFTGSFHIRGAAERLSQNGQSLDGVSFDHDQGVSAPVSFPVESSFCLDGSLTSLHLEITSTSTPFVYRLDFAPSADKSTIWTRLRSPFVYPADIESNPLTLTAETQNAATSFAGRVLDETTRQPISGALVQIGGSQRTTDAKGGFSVDRVPPGSLSVRITKAGYQTYDHTATMPAFFPVTMDFTLSPSKAGLAASIELMPSAKPILPGDDRIAALTFSNNSDKGISELMSADVYLSEAKTLDQSAVRLASKQIFVVAPVAQTFSVNIAISIPDAKDLHQSGAGVRYLVCQLTGLGVGNAPQSLVANPVVSNVFWMGQVINVLTHGFGQEMDLGGLGHLTLIPNFMGVWENLGAKFDSLVRQGNHPMQGSLVTQINRWNSSDGWMQAMFYSLVKIGLEAFRFDLAALEVDAFIESHMRQANGHAVAAAQQSFSSLKSRRILESPDLSQQGYQIIHLIGHSRGGAVNAYLATLLTGAGYRVHQYTALDDYSTDWPPPSDILADINIVQELTTGPALANVDRRINYTVEDGLSRLDPVVNTVYGVVEPFFRLMYAGLIGDGQYDGYSEGLKQAVKMRLPDWKAPDRPLPFTNKRITGLGGIGDKARSNHLNVIDLYLQSDLRPPGEQYIFDNYVGAQLTGRSLAGSLPARQVALQSLPPVSPMTSQKLDIWKFADFQDGSFEELGATQRRIEQTVFPSVQDSLLKLGLAMMKSPRELLSTKWKLAGDVLLVATNGNTLAELTQTEGTSLGQLLIFPVPPLSVDFDLSVKAAGPNDMLQVVFDGQLLREMPLTNTLSSVRLSASLKGRSGAGELRFQLAGPVTTPAVIRLDNIAIVYDHPKITSIELLSDGRIKFAIEGNVGSRYVIEGSADLKSWQELTAQENTTGKIEFMDAKSANLQRRFYRVKLAP